MTDHQNEHHNDEELNSPFEKFLYHQRRALEETGKALEALLPEGFRTHSNEATREFTKGFRVLVDAAIDEFKKASQKPEGGQDDDDVSTTGKTKVKVQVD